MDDVTCVSLTPDETNALMVAMTDASPVERSLLEEQVVAAYLTLASRIAGRYRQRGVDLDDLRQVASLALVGAVRRFDPDRGDFAAFAAVTISGEVKKYFRDHGWMVRPPRSVQELHAAIGHLEEVRSHQAGEPPGIDELASQLGVDRAAVVAATRARGCFVVDSLDAPVFGDGPTLGEGLVGDVAEGDFVESWADFRPAWETLSSEDRELLKLRFFEDMTQDTIARILGMSQMQVSRRLRGVLARIRRQMAVSVAA